MDTTIDFSPYRADGKLPVGQAIIEELAAHGAASIYACDKAASDEGFKPLVDKVHIEHPNTKIIPYPFDVAKEEETLVLIDELLNNFGRLDIWVSSAGLLGPPSITETTPADLQRCLEAHSIAPFFALKYAPAAMAKLTEKKSYPNAAPKTQKYGSIVVIGSVASTYGGCWGPAYVVASHAALGVVKAGVAVLKGTGIDLKGMNSQFPPASLQTQETADTAKKYGLTPDQVKELEKRATAAKATAYCPYSKFRVGATLLSNDDRYTDGANVENASYPVGTCAERVAFGKAITEGIRGFKAVAVATDVDAPCSPCGMCRQFIREFVDLETPILMFNKNGKYVVMRLQQLLPLSFGPEFLPPPEVLEKNLASGA
ncbi:Tropinone reductase-like 2 [Colletotrichum sp. SAR11_59]|nr:Tropinone reductase-like 2 [Colletotrichum sp. SAR11_59]